MVRVYFIRSDGSEQSVSVPEGTSVMHAARDNGVPGIDGDCGGVAACATCHVYVDPQWLARTGQATDETECAMLEFTDAAQDNSRLGCQIVLDASLDGLIVRLPEYQY